MKYVIRIYQDAQIVATYRTNDFSSARSIYWRYNDYWDCWTELSHPGMKPLRKWQMDEEMLGNFKLQPYYNRRIYREA